jgi:transposase
VENGTTALLGLAGLAVARVEHDAADERARVVHVVTDDPAAGCCPGCGTTSSSPKAWATTRPKDLPYGPAPVELVWRKRRWRCHDTDCARKTFTEAIEAVPPRIRTTTRLREAIAQGVEAGRAVDEVATSHGVSWPTAQRAVAAYAARELGEPEPTPLLGMDETRFGRPRWIRSGEESGEGRWVRLEPWETGFVDLRCPRTEGGQGLLGQVDGRSSAAVLRWLTQRDQAFRDAVEIVALDPSAPYAAAVRDALPAARVAVDHFHLVALANQAVTAVRQRVTREQLGRRGRRRDPVWAHRRLLLRGRERLSDRAMARMWNGAIDHEPTGQLLAAWIAKEELRSLLALAAHRDDPRTRETVRRQLWTFYSWCADTDIPELHTLAATIETWWPAVEVFLSTGITNARTEGTNRLVKQVKRAACGFRNRGNYRTRVRLLCTRSTRRFAA